jgi:hypothetical protein
MGTYLNIVKLKKLLTTVAKIKIVLGSIGRGVKVWRGLFLKFIVMFLRAVCLGII